MAQITMPSFREWLANRHPSGEATVDAVAGELAKASALGESRSFDHAYQVFDDVRRGRVSREEHNALLRLHRTYLGKCQDPEMVAVVALAESSHMWDVELSCGYMHAGYEFNPEVTICSSEREVALARTKKIVLDVSHAKSADAYKLLCDLAARASSCGYRLVAERFGD